MVALRQRRLQLEGGIQWRPRSLFDFAVWRFGDKGSVAEALKLAAVESEAIARRRGLEFGAKVGTEADGPALLAGLRHADLTRIACHGRILPDQDAVDLLVAAAGVLPPIVVGSLQNVKAEAHVLGWQKLADLDQASPVVMSSACDSGAVVVRASGERLGLERSLFSAGTIAYVAPQWPVPAAAMRQLMAMVLDRYLASPTPGLAAVLMDVRHQAVDAGLPPLATQASAVFGDGL